MPTYIIDGLPVAVSESDIKKYYTLGNECYEMTGGTYVPIEGRELYVSKEGMVIDRNDTTYPVPRFLYDEDKKIIELNSDFFLMDAEWAFIYNRKLYFTCTIEELP